MTDPAGKLQIRIAPDRVEIRSTRPVQAATLLVGRGVEETARLLPALYGICATAQSAACCEALEAALGLTPDPRTAGLRDRLVAAETVREHLWRILLDWPPLTGDGPDRESMARVIGLHGRLRSALAGDPTPWLPGATAGRPDRPSAQGVGSDLADLVAARVLGESPDDWLAGVTDLAALADWSARTDTGAARLIRRLWESDLGDLGRSSVAFLPPLDAMALNQRLAGPEGKDFVARPDWGGEPRDASPLARRRSMPLARSLAGRLGNGLVPRLAAQLQELAQLAVDLPGNDTEPARVADRLEPGLGLAQVQAARGLLVHRAQVEKDRIADYRILAPTEWSFHPQGAVALGLADLAARSKPAERGELARLFVAAVDPCVHYDLELTDRQHPG